MHGPITVLNLQDVAASSLSTGLFLFPHHIDGPHQSTPSTKTLPVTLLLAESLAFVHSPMPVRWQPLMAAQPDRLRLVASCANT